MKPVTEVRQETAEVLGNAVAEVARRAIRPELDPFKESLDSLVGNLEGYAETLVEQVRAEKKALDALNKQLGDVVATGKSQAAAAADAQARGQKLRERLDALSGELAATCDEQATTVAALGSLRDEVSSWMQASANQADRLASLLGHAEKLADRLSFQAHAFTDFGNSLSGQVSAHATEVLQGIMENRAESRRDASELRSVIAGGFKGQNASSRSAITEILAKVDTGIESITDAFLSAHQRGMTEVAALGAAQQTRHDAAAAEVRSLVKVLGGEIAVTVESGFLQAIERLEAGYRRAADNVAEFHATIEKRLDALQAEFGTVLERLSAGHVDQCRELAKTGQTARRTHRLVWANIILSLTSICIAGVTFWMTGKF